MNCIQGKYKFLILLNIFIFISLLACKEKKNSFPPILLIPFLNKNTNQSSIPDCENSTSSLIETESKRQIHSKREIINCEDTANYFLDSRVFSPNLRFNEQPISKEDTVEIIFQNRKLNLSMKTLLFSTAKSILIDPNGNAKNPKLYNYTEYRVSLKLGDSNSLQIQSESEISPSIAFIETYQKCLSEFQK